MMIGKTFRLPEELIKAIEARAKREGRTVSQLARILLERSVGKSRAKKAA